MKKKYNIAVIGATGNVGRETLNILSERKFPINEVYALASSKSIGKEVSFGDANIKISSLDSFDFHKVDICFFSAGSEVSKKYVQIATKAGCLVIDKSSHFRLNPDIPLIIPEVNLEELKYYKKNNIISNPNCCTIPLALVLKPLDDAFKIKRLIISTYQSTSGAGKNGMDELYNQTKSKYVFGNYEPKIFLKQIAFNIIPQIGEIQKNGSSSEEEKIALELKKIIGNHINSTITCVRVPVFVGHSMSLNVEFLNELNLKEAIKLLKKTDGISINQGATTPIETVGEDYVYVSRIRYDSSLNNTLNLWITADNLRKGASLNGVQIAEELVKHYL